MESHFITSQSDIKYMLKSCNICNRITNNSNFVVDHTELPAIKLSTRKKYAFIVHIKNDITLPIGHWLSLLVFNRRFAVICDGQNQLKTANSNAYENIQTFCSLNKLALTNLKFRCQPTKSLKCGYIALFFVAKFSVQSYNSFKKMCELLNQYSIQTKEQYAMNYVKTHFKVKKYLFT